MTCKHCDKPLRSKFQRSRGKCPACERVEELLREGTALYDAGDHQGVVALIRANAGKLKIKIDDVELHKTPTTEAAQLGLRMLADRVGAIPACARSMGVMCAAHGAGAPASEACNASEPGEAAPAPTPEFPGRIPWPLGATRYCCPNCGSDDIDAEAWTSINDERVGNFAEGGDNFCNDCQNHFKGWCEVDVRTGKCVACYYRGKHDEEFKPLENIGPPPTEADAINEAFVLLKKARDLLAAACAPKSAQRVRLAISSVKGALSNARHRTQRPDRRRIRRAPAMRVQTRGRS